VAQTSNRPNSNQNFPSRPQNLDFNTISNFKNQRHRSNPLENLPEECEKLTSAFSKPNSKINSTDENIQMLAKRIRCNSDTRQYRTSTNNAQTINNNGNNGNRNPNNISLEKQNSSQSCSTGIFGKVSKAKIQEDENFDDISQPFGVMAPIGTPAQTPGSCSNSEAGKSGRSIEKQLSDKMNLNRMEMVEENHIRSNN
jgi:hypothetical protein